MALAVAAVGLPGSTAADESLAAWQVGEVRVTRLVDFAMTRDAILAAFPFATPELIGASPWLTPEFIDGAGRIRFNFQGFLIETPERRLLVDTGLGPGRPGADPSMGRLMAALSMARIAANDIDIVVHTHLHPDHVGWDASPAPGGPVPTFEQARYVIAKPEWDYWATQNPDRAAQDAFTAAVAPFRQRNQIDLVDPNHRITPEVSFVWTPGHTPGHISVRIQSGGRTAWITGDVLHHPVQLVAPEWQNPGDLDKERAALTRTNLCAQWAHSRDLVIGSHFGGRTAGLVRRARDGFRLDARAGRTA